MWRRFVCEPLWAEDAAGSGGSGPSVEALLDQLVGSGGQEAGADGENGASGDAEVPRDNTTTEPESGGPPETSGENPTVAEAVIPQEKLDKLLSQQASLLDKLADPKTLAALLPIEAPKASEPAPPPEPEPEPEPDYESMTPREIVEYVKTVTTKELESKYGLDEVAALKAARDDVARTAKELPDFWDYQAQMIEVSEALAKQGLKPTARQVYELAKQFKGIAAKTPTVPQAPATPPKPKAPTPPPVTKPKAPMPNSTEKPGVPASAATRKTLPLKEAARDAWDKIVGAGKFDIV